MGDGVALTVIDQEFGTVSWIDGFGGYELSREFIVIIFSDEFS